MSSAVEAVAAMFKSENKNRLNANLMRLLHLFFIIDCSAPSYSLIIIERPFCGNSLELANNIGSLPS
jgi:hypothetical protein